MKIFHETVLSIILVFLIVMFATAILQRFDIRREILKNQDILREIRKVQHLNKE